MDDTTAARALVGRYMDGFRAGDHSAILATLADDVVWDLVGDRRLEGRAAFDAEIGNPAFQGVPTLHVDRIIEERGTVVVIGDGAAERAGGDEVVRFAFCDVFTLRGGSIARVESFLVGLSAP